METFLATTGRIFLRLLELHGIDADRFVRDGGHAPEVFRDPAARLPSSAVDVAARAAAARIPDPAFALRAARCWHPSDLGALGFAWLASSTLRTALQRLERYGRILGERARFRLESSDKGLRLVFEHRRKDALVGGAGNRLRAVHRHGHVPDEFRRLAAAAGGDAGPGAPGGPGALGEFLRRPGPLRRGAQFAHCSRARTPTRRCRCPTGRSPARWTRILATQLAELDRSNVAARCKAAVLERMASGESVDVDIARSLHMSRRTLQRKLAEADLTYQQLVDDTRRDLALRYIEDPARSVTEITFLLGFSGQSAFTRAFRRWTGTAPTDFRARQARRAA